MDIEQNKAFINCDNEESLNRDFFKDFYDDGNVETDSYRWTGTVINNNDPMKLGRVQIRINGRYDEMDDMVLPWSRQDISFMGGKNGNFIVPEIGTIVRGYFDQGDIEKPVYDSVAFSNSRTTDVHSEDIATDYPYKMILFETDQHDVMTLNRATGVTEFKHRSGLHIKIGADGSITIDTGLNDTNNTRGNLEINCYGMANITSYDNINVTSEQGNINVSAPNGNVNLGEHAVDKIIDGSVQERIDKLLVNNVPRCLMTGIDHCIGNLNVYT